MVSLDQLESICHVPATSLSVLLHLVICLVQTPVGLIPLSLPTLDCVRTVFLALNHGTLHHQNGNCLPLLLGKDYAGQIDGYCCLLASLLYFCKIRFCFQSTNTKWHMHLFVINNWKFQKNAAVNFFWRLAEIRYKFFLLAVSFMGTVCGYAPEFRKQHSYYSNKPNSDIKETQVQTKSASAKTS